jgi:hypothetical protein
MSEEQRSSIARRVMLVWMCAVVLMPRLGMSCWITDFGADGSFYTDIAQHVRDGQGLVTEVSVFHHAFRAFPHPTSTYPLWPLLYGYCAKLVPVEFVGVWLPTALYFVVILLAYLLGKRLVPQRLFEALPVHGGHLLAALFACNFEFALATSRPYTEGLAFTLLLSLLLRAPALWRRLGLWAGAELGLWLIVLFLTRSQFVVIGLAALAAVPFALLSRSWRQVLPFLLGGLGSATLIWQLYARWLGTFLPEPSLLHYMRLDLARIDDRLSEVPFMVPHDSLAERLLDLLVSLGWAFSLHGDLSYHASFSGGAYAVLVAALVLASRWRRLPVARRLLQGPRGPFLAFFHLVALALMASLHPIHQIYRPPWIFGSRLAFPAVLLVALALLYLLRSRQILVRAVGVLLSSASLYGGWVAMAERADVAFEGWRAGKTIESYRLQVRLWLQSEQQRLGELTVAAERPEAQHLAWRTQDVGFHWLSESTTVDDLVVMVNDLEVKYVLLFEDVRNAKFTRDPAFDTYFAPLPFREVPEGQTELARVYAPRCDPFPTVVTCLR